MKKILSILAGVVVLSPLRGHDLLPVGEVAEAGDGLPDRDRRGATDIVKKTVATGSVVPRQEVEIKPQVSGIVDELYVEAGQPVKEGDLIARIRLVPDMVNLNNAQNRADARPDRPRRRALEGLRAQPEARHRRADLATPSSSSSSRRTRTPRPSSRRPATTSSSSRRASPAPPAATTNTLVRSTIDGMVLEVPVEVGHSVIETNTFNAGHDASRPSPTWTT